MRPSFRGRNPAAFTLLVSLLAHAGSGCGLPVTDSRVSERIERIDEQRLRRHVEILTREGPRSLSAMDTLENAARYIEEELASYGYRAVREEFEARSASGRRRVFANVIAEIPAGEDAAIVELGAHYDTVEASPGADDNASGVAGALEVARALAGSRCRRTIRFSFFTLEEYGKGGSRHHVRRIRERGEPVEGILVFEMVGYTSREPGSQRSPVRIPFLVWPPRTGDFITVVGNLRSGGLGARFERAARRYVPDLEVYSVKRLGGVFEDSRRSDHEPYWEAGYRGIMLTDTANFRNPHYHRPSDTVETLDFTFLRRVAMATGATLLEWAELTAP